jgi:hypothetical protein
MRTKTLISVLAACGLLSGALALAAANPAGAAAKTPPPVVTGVVKYKGKVIRGADVVLIAEPPPGQLKKDSKKHLEKLPIKIIGSGKSNKKGRYAISVTGKGLRLATAYSFIVHKRRVVNLQVEAYWSKQPTGAAFWFVRLDLGSVLGATAARDSVLPAAGPAEMAPQVANLNLKTMYIPKSLEADYRQAMRAAAGPDAPDPGNPAFCNQELSEGNGREEESPGKYVGLQPPVVTDVGETYSNMSDVTMDFEYGAGQNSSLGVGISITPPQGTKNWPAWGLIFASAGWQDSVQSGAGIPYNSTSGYTNTDYRTKFLYELYFEPCVGFSTAPVGFAGGNSQVTAYPPQSETNQWCQWYEPNKTLAYTFSDSTAYEFTAGVNISFWAGIDLSSQTGYDGNATASYLLPKGGYICGTTGYAGGNNEGLLYAGKYVHSPKLKRVKKAKRR